MTELNRHVAEQPGSALGWAMLGVCNSELKRYPEAEDALRRSLRLEPNQPRALTQLGWVLSEMKRFPEAEEVLQRAISLNARLAEAYQTLAEVRQARGDSAGCADSARKALDLAAPARPVAGVHLLAGCLLQAGRHDEAADLLAPIASRPDSQYLLAEVRYNQGDYTAAAGLCRKVLQAHPGLPSAELLLALSLVQLGMYAEAEAAYLRILKPAGGRGGVTTGVSAKVHESYGQLLLLLDRGKEAEESFSKALALDPRNAPALLGRARLLHRSGRTQAARADAEKALEADPENGTAHVLLVRIYLELGLPDRAKAMADWLDEKNRSFMTGGREAHR